MLEIDAAHGRRGHHREALREGDPDLRGVEQVEQAALGQVVRAGGVTEGRADAAVALGHEVLLGEILVGTVAPLAPHPSVHHLGERLGQPVGEGLDHDRRVVVEEALVRLGEVVGPDARRHGERAHVVDQPRLARSDEVGQRVLGLVVGLDLLLAQHGEAGNLGGALAVGVENDVIAL